MLVYARDFPFHEFESFSCQSGNLNFAEEFGMQNIFFKRIGFLNIDICTFPFWKVQRLFPENSGFHCRKGKTSLKFSIQGAFYKLVNN